MFAFCLTLFSSLVKRLDATPVLGYMDYAFLLSFAIACSVGCFCFNSSYAIVSGAHAFLGTGQKIWEVKSEVRSFPEKYC